jgi:hypothetical protein
MLNSLKKVPLLFIFFSFLILNLFFIATCYLNSKKQSYQESLLTEIGSIKNNSDKQFVNSHAPFVLGAMTPDIQLSDARSANLRSFFRKYNSPLYDDAEYIVALSDQYGFDYRLLPAIAMQESNLCKYIPENSYNCWGWGIYGDNVLRFKSYRETMQAVASGIKEHYIDQGLVTPESIMAKYTPPSKGSWSNGVTYFFNMLE